MAAKKPARHWCFTLNNHTDEHVEILCSQYDDIRYIIFGEEVGENGTPHLQGYIEFKDNKRVAGIKKLFGIKEIHLEARGGTRDQARDYCMKDGSFVEYGNWNEGGHGARTDLYSIMDSIKANTPKLEVMEEAPMVYSKHIRFCTEYRAACEAEFTKEFRNVEVTVYYGPAGSGKTSRVMDETNRDVFTVNAGETFPFDGYDGEESILIDDFYGTLKYGDMLRILDGHQYRVNIKGGLRYAQWTRVYITSNVPPAEWYKTGLTPALARRLTHVIQIQAPEGDIEKPQITNPILPEPEDNLIDEDIDYFGM